jgi:hypothetical protein
MTIVEAMQDRNLFGRFFGPSWSTWAVLLKAVFKIPMTESERGLFSRLSARLTVPLSIWQLWILAGRRSGKTKIAMLIGIWQATAKDWTKVLSAGEIGVVLLICPDRAQARVLFGYAQAFVEQVPFIRTMVLQMTKETILFNNRIRLEIRTASYRTIRGYSVVAAIVDEAAFLRDESSSNPFGEILTALKPAMATTNGILIVISTPYSRTGEIWNHYQRYHGKEDDHVLFVTGPTQLFNPTIPSRVVKEAFEADPSAAASEFGSLEEGISFRRDIEQFVSREAVEAVVVPGRQQLPPVRGVHYHGFCDPSGGSVDSMTLAIAHEGRDGGAVLDVLLERKPPFSPDQVVQEFAATLNEYRIEQVIGDAYAGAWPRERFANAGITYEPSASPKSDLYRELLPKINAGHVELLDHPRLIQQLLGLERRTARSGKDSIDHAPGGHDDLVNAATGALLAIEQAAASRPQIIDVMTGRRLL